jgi:hypothetical protein
MRRAASLRGDEVRAGSPPRDATDHYLECMNRQLDIVFDADLGELTR